MKAITIVAQGDDDQVTVATAAEAVCLTASYKTMGLDVNPSKTFISNDRDEFLRTVFIQDKVVGYPARSINSLMWANPIGKDKPKGSIRLGEQLSNWLITISRTSNPRGVIEHMVTDMSKGNDLSREHVVRWLGTPTVQGGAGLFSSDKPVNVSSVVQERLPMHIKGPGLTDIAVRSGNIFSMKLNKTAFAREKIDVSPVQTVELETFVTNIDPISSLAIHSRLGIPIKTNAVWKENLSSEPGFEDWFEKEWPTDMGPYLEDRSRKEYEVISKSCTLKIQKDWLLSRLGLSIPNMLDWAPRFISVVFGPLSEMLWGTTVRRSKSVSDVTIKKMSILLGIWTVNILSKRPVLLSS